LIDAFGVRQDEMMAGPIAGTVEILRELRDRGTLLYALSNWPAEGFVAARERFDFLGWFRGIVISGEIGAIKPQPRIYEVLIERFAIDPLSAIFIDDVEDNAAAARPFGMHAIQFTNPAALRAELVALGLL
jgi:2-haloacid dehalogenase